MSEFRAATVPGTMRWYGWGDEAHAFDPSRHPYLWDYAHRHLSLSPDDCCGPLPDPHSIPLPASRLTAPLRAALSEALPADGLSESHMDRLVHASGRSTRDLWRLRHGRVDWAPDAVVFPRDEETVVRLLEICRQFGAAVIPFGGGSNVAGCLELAVPDPRPVISVNMRRMNRFLAIDRTSCLVRVQAGILGPDLEAGLAREGLTLGHVPDSFPFSTLGGWIATRSAGMYSDGYGNAEDMVVSLRLVTPNGLVTAAAVPHASHGPDAHWLAIGSEGALGIITEVTLQTRPLPAHREFRAYLFPQFSDGLDAHRAVSEARCLPVLTRLNDVAKTQLSVAFRAPSQGLKHLVGQVGKKWIERSMGMPLDQACAMILAFEGSERQIAAQRREVEAIYRRFGAKSIGRGPGEAFAAGKFDFPYIRDFLFDYKVMVDVSETAIPWSGMMPLYRDVMAKLGAALGRGGRPFWLGCHVSHTYPTGASLYFSFAFHCLTDGAGQYDARRELDHYLSVKRVAQECFAAHGATLSHHHAVGYENLGWMLDENRCGPGTLVEAVKDRLDPADIMNPGKMVSPR